MTKVITKRRFKLTAIFASLALLSACGAGTDINSITTDVPEVGQAIETADNSALEAPIVLSPATPTVAVPTPAIEASIPTPIPTQPLQEQEPVAVTEPEVAPEAEAEAEAEAEVEVEIEVEVEAEAEAEAEVEAEPIPETLSVEPLPVPEPLPVEPAPEPETTSAPPSNVSCTASSEDIQSSTLSLINNARAVARFCGDTFFEAASPLTWNSKLATAARLHSDDMAMHNFFSHTGSDGLSVSARVDAQQYVWRSVGENIAAGQPTTESVVDAWLESPGHCKNLMNSTFEEVAVECVENTGSQYRQYWTNVLGTSF